MHRRRRSAMGIFIDYAFHNECSEEELLARLCRLRRKLLKLPFDHVSRVLRVDPVYLAVPLLRHALRGGPREHLHGPGHGPRRGTAAGRSGQLRVLRAPRLVAQRRRGQRRDDLCAGHGRSLAGRNRESPKTGRPHPGHERSGDAQLQLDPGQSEGPDKPHPALCGS